MSRDNVYKPFDAGTHLGNCGCGCQNGRKAPDDGAPARPSDPEIVSRDFMEMAAVRAILPNDRTRRRFLKAVGVSTAIAAIHSVLPIQALQAMAAETSGPLEKKNLNVGFIPICCATPLIMADPLGFYRNEGLNVSLIKTAGWALVRDKMLNRELDASHFLSPMPLAITMGLSSQAQPMRVATIQNINGQAITLALKHKDNRDPKNWKGFKFAIPFEYSMHNFLLRYYLAEHGIDPDRDVQLRVTPPAEMVANLRAGNIDGFLGPEPFNQRAIFDEIGFIHILTKDIWDGHPCCAFGISQAFIEQNPNSFAALFRAMLKASASASDHANRDAIAKAIAPAQYLNQPEIVIRQSLTGHYADGLGNVRNDPDRIGFDPMPWYSMAAWMLTQMKRWGYVKQDIDYKSLAREVFLLTDATRLMAQLDMPVDEHAKTGGYAPVTVMGRVFDPSQAAAYADSFPIKRT
ncbi:MAG: CmpA/NrtA family ABC transporter substrate-binding protein [Beijerinckiaceae bacterium]|nr:CmpA/NrtA family ABC transporter substrate-binding protein [Beijerinckiaceae bacterium]